MKTTFTAARAKLLAGLKSVKGAIDGNGIDALFGYVKIDTLGNDSVLISACNGKSLVTSRVMCRVHDAGKAALVAGNKLLAFVAALPEGLVDMDLEHSVTMAKVTGGETSFSVSRRDVADFMALTMPDGEGVTFTVKAMALAEMIRKTRFAAAGTGDARAVLRGICLEIKGGLLTLTAADGRRLSTVEHEVTDTGDCQAILPIDACDNVSRLIRQYDFEGDVDVRVIDTRCSFTSRLWSLTTVLVEGAFPNWRMTIPKDGSVTVELRKVDRKLMLECLSRAMLAMKADEKNVKIKVTRWRIDFSSRSPMGVCATTMPTEWDGADFELNVNPELLRDVLNAIDEENVKIDLTSPTTPIMVTCGVPYLSIIQPLSLED